MILLHTLQKMDQVYISTGEARLSAELEIYSDWLISEISGNLDPKLKKGLT